MNRFKIISTILILFGSGLACAQNSAVTGYCVKGATPATTSGLNSTNTLQGVVPGGPAGCLVQVYVSGTVTPATIYSTVGGTVLTNPFRATTSGQWVFYAATGAYDIVLSGGLPPNAYSSPVTLTGLQAGGGSGGSGCNPSGATNALQKNNGSGGCAASSVIDNGSSVSTSEPLSSPVVNATTGFQISGTAPSGHCLLGNGTDYVDSASCGSGGGGITALTGDVTASGSGSVVATVVKVNGASLPTSTNVVGTNGSGQIIASSNGSATVFGPVKVDGTTITATGGVISATGSGSCAIGTCIVNNGTASQTITQATGTNFGWNGTSWGINPVLSSGDFEATLGEFPTYTGDTGLGSVNGGVTLQRGFWQVTNPGWDWGIGTNANPLWQTSVGFETETQKFSAGIGSALSTELRGFGVGDLNGVDSDIETHGGFQALSDEGTTGFNSGMHEGAAGSGTIMSGGTTGSSSLTVANLSNVGVGRVIIDSSSTTGVISTTQTITSTVNIASGNMALVGLGTTVTASTCGVLSGGQILPSTSYAITGFGGFNIITIQATNTLYGGEQVTLGGYGTSTFLNGYSATVVPGTLTSSQFSLQIVHANTSATEAGNYFTVNVDTPRQAAAGTTSMTFGITLGSSYGGSTTALTAALGTGFYDAFNLTSVGSYSGGIQNVTANLRRPILAGAEVCIGGLAGYGELNTTMMDEGLYNLVLGSPSTTSAYIASVQAGRPSGATVYAGSVVLRPMATIESIVPSGVTVGLGANNVAWGNGDTVTVPNGIAARYVGQNNKIQNGNFYASYVGLGSSYFGVAAADGGQLIQLGGEETPSTLQSQCLTTCPGNGYAPIAVEINGYVGMGMNFEFRPTDSRFNGNNFPNSLLNVGSGCDIGFICPTTYFIHSDGTHGNPGGGIQYTPASNLYNFLGAGGNPATIEENGVTLCKSSGVNCPSFGTVTSVALTTPSWLTVAGSPVTTAGTLAVTATTGLTANQFLATPNGTTGALAPRAIVAADIPTLNQNTTGQSGTVNTIAPNVSFSTGLTATGAGTIASPYVVTATGGTPTVIQVNGTATTTATPVNLRNGTGNGGVAITNPSTGNVDVNLSKPFGAGANFTTGPASNTSGDIAYFPGTDGRIADSGVLSGNVPQYNVANPFTGANTFISLNTCSDTSGSGTAQVCNTLNAFTPTAGSCIVYTTSTANTGAGLTLNVNSLGAKSVSKWMGSTTTLAANDVRQGKDTWVCYDGTTWELSDIGNPPSGGGSVTWDAIGTPVGSLALTFPSADTTTLTAGSATSTSSFFTLADTASNTGTGYLLKLATNTSSTMLPLGVFAAGGTIPALSVLANGNTTIGALGVATGGGNFGSNTLCLNSAHFNVTSLTDTYCTAMTVATGTNPITTITNTFASASTGTVYVRWLNSTTGSGSSGGFDWDFQGKFWHLYNNGGTEFVDTNTSAVQFNGTLTTPGYLTETNCSSSASPAVCGSAAAGSVSVAAAATTVVVNTSRVTANSQINLTFDASLGTKLTLTCNTTPSVAYVSARSPGTSFTITTTAPVTNPACFSYTITN